jgi:hypothetical protein
MDHSGGLAFRAPLLPFDVVERLTGGAARAAWTGGGDLEAAVAGDTEHLAEVLRGLLADPVVRAAVAYASPDLDDALDRWEPGEPAPRGLVGYAVRMAGRAVPFGLFAGCASGAVEGTPAYRLGPERSVRARLDVAAAEALATSAGGVRYVPNGTLHAAAGRLRLVERVADGAAVRYHPLAVEPNDAIDAVLDAARDGATLDVLATALVDGEVTYDDAYGFVTALADAQLLVPDVAVVTGEVEGPGELRAFEASPSRETLRDAVAAVRARVDVPRDRAVHVDLARPGSFVLGDEVLAEARRAVDVLHRLYRETPDDADLAAFAERFAARYGDAEVPLLPVLDPEHGIGYGAPPALATAGAPLLAGFNPAPSTDGPAWTPIDHHLVDLLSRALRDGATRIEVPPGELHSLRNQRPRPLPPSVAVLATVAARSAEAVAAGDFRLVVHGVEGPNAVAAFARFAPLDDGLDALARAHVAAERSHAVLAEVVHLPERRSGNVAVRPRLRDAEIPVLAGSAAPDRVAPADLRVSVADGRVVLRDADGREVVPRLSAPHEAATSALPLYRFLAAVQRDGVAGTLRWSWGQVESAPYLPRVVVGRLVLARAKWRWFRAELREVRGARTPAARYAAVQRLREAWGLPRWAALARGATEVPLDLDGVAASELLAHEARRAGQVTVRELLPGPDELCLEGPDGRYAHEVVLPLLTGARPPEAPRRTAPARRDGTAVRVTCGPVTADAVLRVAASRADGPWAFERTRDGVRVLLADGDALRDALAPLVDDGRVADVAVGPGAPPDGVAYADSAAVARLLGDDLDARWRAAYWGLDRLLADAGLDPYGRREVVVRLRDRLVTGLGETGERARRHAGRLHRARRAGLVSPDEAVAAAWYDRSRATVPLLNGAPADVLERACAAQVNRVLRAAHDVQAVVLYDLLDRRYRAYGQ